MRSVGVAYGARGSEWEIVTEVPVGAESLPRGMMPVRKSVIKEMVVRARPRERAK